MIKEISCFFGIEPDGCGVFSASIHFYLEGIHQMRCVFIFLLGIMLTGCAHKVEPGNKESLKPLAYTQENIDSTVTMWMDQLIGSSPINAHVEPPAVGFVNILNKTRSSEIDTSIFMQAFEYWGLKSQKFRFIKLSKHPKKSEGFVSEEINPIAAAKRCEVNYLFHGQMSETPTTHSESDHNTYLTVFVELTNVETNEDVWSGRQNFVIVQSRRSH